MKLTESHLRRIIRQVLLEIGDTSASPRQIKFNSSSDRNLNVYSPSKSNIASGDISQSDAVKLMSASTGFFQTLVDAIRFGFLTREQVNKICDSLSVGCEDNFKNLNVVHPCLNWWKNDVSKIAERIDAESEFKRDFCESIISNCEMVKSNFNKALGNIRQISI